MSPWVDAWHERHVRGRRSTVLAGCIGPLLSPGRWLDVGSGDGTLAAALQKARAGVRIEGVDTLVRPDAAIEVTPYDGVTLPFADRSFDGALIVDVLHHTDDPLHLLREVGRVCRGSVVIKDHLAESAFDRWLLKRMDRVGNARFGVALPCRYASRREWEGWFAELEWEPAQWDDRVRLYPRWANWFFGRGLHFIVRLEAAKP